MRTNLLSLLCLVVIAAGCGTMTIKPGADPVVVYAEVAAENALTAFDAFVEWEYKNQELVKAKAPDVHAAANEIRRNGLVWITELRTATKAYQEKPDTERLNKLQAARELVEFAAQEVRTHMLSGKDKL